jgi:hypothetical protein
VVFADGHELARLQHQASVTGGIGRAKTEHCDRRALGQRLAQARQGLGPDQRRIGKDDQDIVGSPRQRGFGHQHGMRRAASVGLHHDFGTGQDAPRFLRNRVMARPDYDHGFVATRVSYGRQHV